MKKNKAVFPFRARERSTAFLLRMQFADMPDREIKWIDTARALCMMAVYWVHSEIYYGVSGGAYGYVVLPFYVNAFFFVSGYLFFRKYLDSPGAGPDSCRGVANVIFRLMLPTILFSSFIYIPKKLFHGDALSFGQYLYDVFGGLSYWFTSALAVAQLLLLALVRFRRLGMWHYVVLSCAFFALGVWSFIATENTFPWNYQAGLSATLFMSLGGVYFKHEGEVNKWLVPYGVMLAAGAYVLGVALTWRSQSLAVMVPFQVDFWGLVVVFCSIISLVALARVLPPLTWLRFVGRNSIVFYFFSGVMPAMWSTVLRLCFPGLQCYGGTLLVLVLSLALSAVLCMVINRYFPFLLDARKLSCLWKRFHAR